MSSSSIKRKQHKEMVKLRDAVTETRSMEIQIKPALWAFVCDCCGRQFMPADKAQNADNCKMWGKFTGASTTAQGYMNNHFYARICSFECAGKLMNGGWKELEEFEPYVAQGATLAFVEVKMALFMRNGTIIT